MAPASGQVEPSNTHAPLMFKANEPEMQQAVVSNVEVKKLEESFKKELTGMKTIMHAQEHAFKAQFDKLLDVAEHRNIERKSAEKDLRDL